MSSLSDTIHLTWKCTHAPDAPNASNAPDAPNARDAHFSSQLKFYVEFWGRRGITSFVIQ